MSDSGACVVAIDLGTSGPRVAVIDERGAIRGAHSESVGFEFVGEHGAEQDPEAIWRATLGAVARAVAASRVPPERIVALICDSQYSSVVPVASNGDPVGPLFLYLDQRGAPHARAMLERHPELWGRWLEVHGRPCTGSGEDSLSSMLYVQEERPEIFEKTHCFLEPMDYVTARFTGHCAANQCTVEMMLVGDNRRFDTREYCAELVSATGIDPSRLPELAPVGAVLGAVQPSVAAQTGLSTRTQVVAAVNDSQALAMGTCSYRGTHLGLSIGTTLVPITFVDRLDAKGDRLRPLDFSSLLLPQPAPLASPKGHHLVMAELGLAGKALEQLLGEVVYAHDRLGDHRTRDPFASLEQAVTEVPPGSDGVLFFPWLTGSWMPVADDAARGGYLNLSLRTTRQHLLRATLEGVAYQLRWALPGLADFTGHTCECFYFGGGGARSQAWAQILADVCDTPVRPMAEPQYTLCRGAAMLAFHRLGRLDLEDFPAWLRFEPTCEPRAEHRALYDALSEQYVKAHEALKPIFHALNG
ncbi:MAG: FGGY-family carbohydrate kinase [Myxococcota bacterium]